MHFFSFVAALEDSFYHYQARKTEGNCFTDTSNAPGNCNLSANLADSSCTGGDMVCDSTSTSVTDGLCGSCIGTWACQGFTGSIGRNSCTGDGSCRNTYNTAVNIGDNSCNGGTNPAGGSPLSSLGGANACRNLRLVTIGDNRYVPCQIAQFRVPPCLFCLPLTRPL